MTRLPYRAVLFDIDGTLVDSNDAHARAWVDALAEHGIAVQYDEIRRRIGMGGDKLLPGVTGMSEESDAGERISTRRREIFKERYLPQVQAFPEAAALVSALKSQGFTVVAASSAKKDELGPLLDIAGVDDLMDAATSSDDAEGSKPDPDIVEAALRTAKCAAGDAIMIGDTPYDVQAATRAGVPVIGLRCGGWGDEDLKGAVAVYDDPADLLARLGASPLGSR